MQLSVWCLTNSGWRTLSFSSLSCGGLGICIVKFTPTSWEVIVSEISLLYRVLRFPWLIIQAAGVTEVHWERKEENRIWSDGGRKNWRISQESRVEEKFSQDKGMMNNEREGRSLEGVECTGFLTNRPRRTLTEKSHALWSGKDLQEILCEFLEIARQLISPQSARWRTCPETTPTFLPVFSGLEVSTAPRWLLPTVNICPRSAPCPRSPSRGDTQTCPRPHLSQIIISCDSPLHKAPGRREPKSIPCLLSVGQRWAGIWRPLHSLGSFYWPPLSDMLSPCSRRNPAGLATGPGCLTTVLFACLGRTQYRFSKVNSDIVFRFVFKCWSKPAASTQHGYILITYLNTVLYLNA